MCNLYIMQVRLGCFFEIPQSAIPSHPLLGFVYSSLKVAASSKVFRLSLLEGTTFSLLIFYVRGLTAAYDNTQFRCLCTERCTLLKYWRMVNLWKTDPSNI